MFNRYKKADIFPEALLNFTISLGWDPKKGQPDKINVTPRVEDKVYTNDEIIEKVSN